MTFQKLKKKLLANFGCRAPGKFLPTFQGGRIVVVLCCLFLVGFGNVSPNVCSYYFSSVWVAVWPPFGKELLKRLTICSVCISTICYSSKFPFWSLGSDCSSSWSLHTCYF